MARMRLRVSSLTIGLPRSARDTVGWDTPARWAMSSEVAFPLMGAITDGFGYGRQRTG